MKKIFLLSLAALGIWACSGTKNASTATKTEKVVETTAKVERTGSVDTAALRKSIDSLMALQVGEVIRVIVAVICARSLVEYI